MKIKKGDTVKVISGKDTGKKSKVLQVLPQENKLIIEEVNVFVRHLRPRRAQEKGQKVQFNSPLKATKVMLVCPKCSQPTRVGFKFLENKKKVRLCRKCKQVID